MKLLGDRMLYNLIYFTYGEETSSAYRTQVIELLNNWSNRPNWKVTLVQVSFSEMFSGLNNQVTKIHIKRERRFPINSDKKKYVKKLLTKIELNDDGKVYFNSRGGFAYTISKMFAKKLDIDCAVNNMDIRGIEEELKYSFKTYFA